jgi:hypothetical protein
LFCFLGFELETSIYHYASHFCVSYFLR